jgi:hypothetical protein
MLNVKIMSLYIFQKKHTPVSDKQIRRLTNEEVSKYLNDRKEMGIE